MIANDTSIPKRPNNVDGGKTRQNVKQFKQEKIAVHLTVSNYYHIVIKDIENDTLKKNKILVWLQLYWFISKAYSISLTRKVLFSDAVMLEFYLIQRVECFEPLHNFDFLTGEIYCLLAI